MKKLLIFLLSLPKTIYFNFRYLSISNAIKLPVLVHYSTNLSRVEGLIKLEKVLFGTVKIGFGDIPIFKSNSKDTTWHVSGVVIFKGKCNLNKGSKISVSGKLILGDEFKISAASTIIATKYIEFGNNSLVSWGSQIMDTDFHKIICLENDVLINEPQSIIFGKNIWISSYCIIGKGINLSNDIILASGTVLTKSFEESNVIIGDRPNRILKSNIRWEM